MVDVVADDMFVAMRCFQPRRLINWTVLSDKESQSIMAPTLFLVGENEKICWAQEAAHMTPSLQITVGSYQPEIFRRNTTSLIFGAGNAGFSHGKEEASDIH